MGWMDLFGDDEDDKPAQPEESEPTAPSAPTPDAAASIPAPQTAGQPSSNRDLILKQLGMASDMTPIRDAEDRAFMGNMALAAGQAAEGFARAPAVARGGPGVNHATYQNISQSLDRGVDRATQQRQQGMQDVLTQHTLGKQLDEEDQQTRYRDPKSQESADFRTFIQGIYPDIKIPETMSYAEAKEKVPLLANAYEANKTRETNAKERASAVRDAAQTRADSLREGSLTRGMIAAQGQQARQDAAATKADDKTNAQFTQFTDHLKGTIRDSVGDEKKKLRNATHAMAIMDQGNLDNLTPEQVKEVAGVLAAQVTAGSPAESTIHAMTPKTAKGDIAKVMSYISGDPEAANQGNYVQMFKDMVARQMDTSKEIIAGELKPVIANYGHLAQKDPDRFKQILSGAGLTVDQDGQLTAYEPSYSKGKGKPGQGGKSDGGTAYAAPGGAAPADHPQDDAARAWAEANPKDPRAQKILSIQGAGGK